MLKKNKVTTEYITAEILEKTLDERLVEQTQIILSAIDGRFNKMDDRIDKLETELKSDINNSQISLDGYVKAQEDFKQEFVIMQEETRQIKQVCKQKLGVEIRAF